MQDYITTGAFVYGALERGEKYGALERSEKYGALKASGDLRPPSLPPVSTKQRQAAEGGAKPQVGPLTNTCQSPTNSCFACTPAELSKATNLTLITKTNMPLGEELKAKTLVIFIKTKLVVKPRNSVLPFVPNFYD